MDYKSYVGNPKHYELIGQTVFELLLKCGLKREHKLLDIGCGSLRVGKHIINYLNDNNYYGIEPNRWLVTDAIIKEKINVKKDFEISRRDDFNLSFFSKKYKGIYSRLSSR